VSGPLPDEEELGGDPPCWAAQFEEAGLEEPEEGLTDGAAVEEDGPGA
jgi:hypothetical protein